MVFFTDYPEVKALCGAGERAIFLRLLAAGAKVSLDRAPSPRQGSWRSDQYHAALPRILQAICCGSIASGVPTMSGIPHHVSLRVPDCFKCFAPGPRRAHRMRKFAASARRS